MSKKKAFTLIELIVVISIIVLLISILVPAIAMVKNKARVLICQTNMKQLVSAWQMYSDTNNNDLCISINYQPMWGEHYDYPEAWAWAPWEVNGDEPASLPATQEEKQEGVKRGSLYHFPQMTKVYHCPGDKSLANHYRSYSIPDCLNGTYAYLEPSATWKILKKITNIRNPSEAYVFLEENDPGDYNMDSWCLDPDSIYWWDPISIWHGRTATFAFADGHSMSRKWSDETTEAFKDPENNAWYYEPYTDGGIQDLRWMQRGWAK